MENKTNTAIKFYNEALAVESTNLHALIEKGLLLLKENRLKEGVEILEKAHDKEPLENQHKNELNEACKTLAEESRNAKDFAKARFYYTLSLKLYPDNASSLFEKGKANYELCSYQNAIEDFEHSLKLEKEHPESHIYLGVTYFKVKNYAASINWLNKANKLKPNDPFILGPLDEAHKQIFKNLRKMF